MRKMKSRNNLLYIIFGIVVLVLGLYLLIHYQISHSSLINKKTTENITEEQLIMNKFSPYWRGTNNNCTYYNSILRFDANGEISYTTQLNNSITPNFELKVNYVCTVKVNDNPQFNINIFKDITWKDNSYLGNGNVFESNTITICCGTAGCNTITLNPLC